MAAVPALVHRTRSASRSSPQRLPKVDPAAPAALFSVLVRAALEPTRPADEPAWCESALSAVDEPGAKLTRAHRHALRAGGRHETSLVAARSSGTWTTASSSPRLAGPHRRRRCRRLPKAAWRWHTDRGVGRPAPASVSKECLALVLSDSCSISHPASLYGRR